MKAAAKNRRERVRAMLADLKMPGALEVSDDILAQADGGNVTAGEAIEKLLGAQIELRNNRRLNSAMRTSRLPAVKTLAEFDFAFQPSIKREQIESLHELGFVDRAENVILLVVDEIGYLPVTQEGAILFFQLINARHERASTVLTSNKGFEEWGGVLGDEVMAAALIDRLLHHCHIVNIRGNSYRMREHQDLLRPRRADEDTPRGRGT